MAEGPGQLPRCQDHEVPTHHDVDPPSQEDSGRSKPLQHTCDRNPGQEEGSSVPIPSSPTRQNKTAASRRTRALGRVLLAVVIVLVNVLVVGRIAWRWQLRATVVKTISTTAIKGNHSKLTITAGVRASEEPVQPNVTLEMRTPSSNATSTIDTSPRYDTRDSLPVQSDAARDKEQVPRIPKRSPHHVYQCGYLQSTSLVNALFPEANVTNLQHEPPPGLSMQQLVRSFRPDDLMLVTCGGPCVIPHIDLPIKFPGKLLHIVGESSRSVCHLSLSALRRRHNASIVEKFERRLTSITRVGSPRSRWNESTFNVALLIASNNEKEGRDVYYRSVNRPPRNTGKHFLMYANSHCVPFREDAFRQLSTLGFEVHYAGNCDGSGGSLAGRGGDGRRHNATVVRVQENPKRHGYAKNKFLYHDYRFTLAMENAAVPGYITEKILMPFTAGSVPIYYGTREVFDIFNRNAFVWYDVNNPQPALDRILYLERNRSAYEDMLRQPLLADGEATVAKYFSIRDEDGNGRLKWAIRDRIGFG